MGKPNGSNSAGDVAPAKKSKPNTPLKEAGASSKPERESMIAKDQTLSKHQEIYIIAGKYDEDLNTFVNKHGEELSKGITENELLWCVYYYAMHEKGSGTVGQDGEEKIEEIMNRFEEFKKGRKEDAKKPKYGAYEKRKERMYTKFEIFLRVIDREDAAAEEEQEEKETVKSSKGKGKAKKDSSDDEGEQKEANAKHAKSKGKAKKDLSDDEGDHSEPADEAVKGPKKKTVSNSARKVAASKDNAKSPSKGTSKETKVERDIADSKKKDLSPTAAMGVEIKSKSRRASTESTAKKDEEKSRSREKNGKGVARKESSDTLMTDAGNTIIADGKEVDL